MVGRVRFELTRLRIKSPVPYQLGDRPIKQMMQKQDFGKGVYWQLRANHQNKAAPACHRAHESMKT